METTACEDVGQMERLIEAYRRGWKAITAELEAIADDPAKFRRRARLVEMQKRIALILRDLETLSRSEVARGVPLAYQQGAREMAGLTGQQWRYTQADQEVVRKLADDTFDDLLKRTRFINLETKKFVRRIVRDRVLLGEVAGRSGQETKARVREYLDAHGVKGIRYRDGRHVDLDDYADMVVRTKRVVARNVGGLMQAKRDGVEFLECFDGPGCGWSTHTDGDQANGKVVSHEEAMKYLISHPRCRRTFGPRPDVTSAKDAARAKPSTTLEQVQDQRRQDAERRARLLRRRNARLAARARRVRS